MTEVTYQIRDFLFPGDYPRVILLWQTAGSGVNIGTSDSSEEIQKKIKRDPDLFLVAEIEGRIVGSVLGGFDGRRGLVYHLAVTPNFQRNGIGAALMEELEKRLRTKGCLRSYLLVTKDNHDAVAFYEKQNWQLMDIHLYGKDLVDND